MSTKQNAQTWPRAYQVRASRFEDQPGGCQLLPSNGPAPSRQLRGVWFQRKPFGRQWGYRGLCARRNSDDGEKQWGGKCSRTKKVNLKKEKKTMGWVWGKLNWPRAYSRSPGSSKPFFLLLALWPRPWVCRSDSNWTLSNCSGPGTAERSLANHSKAFLSWGCLCRNLLRLPGGILLYCMSSQFAGSRHEGWIKIGWLSLWFTNAILLLHFNYNIENTHTHTHTHT